jgi:hypothetical protein
MSIGISKLFEDSERLMDKCRLTPAVRVLEKVRSMTKIPDRYAWATYNLGAIYYHLFGDGEAAREEFIAATAKFDAHGYGKRPRFIQIHSAAIENTMLMALSFEEFERLAERLKKLTPDAPVLAGLVPQVNDLKDRGGPWSDAMFKITYGYYNRNDPKLDAGRYGQAKSTYHVMLTNRRKLRLKREDWRLAVNEYAVLAMRMATDCWKRRGSESDPNSPEEYLPILTQTLPLIDEYLEANSGDDEIRQHRKIIQDMIAAPRQQWSTQNGRDRGMPDKTQYYVCQKCGHIYARRDVSGPGFAMDMGDSSTVCIKCHGDVRWQSSPKPRKGGMGGLFVLLLIVATVAGYYFFR